MEAPPPATYQIFSHSKLIHFTDKYSSFDHVFHLHGHSFRAVGQALDLKEQNLEALKELDRSGQLMDRNLVSAVEKDTITVPKNGAVALRFRASRPGEQIFATRLFRCQNV